MIANVFQNLDFLTWLLALVGASAISILAWFVRSLSTSGMIAAILLGTIVTGAGGWWSGALLIVFFATASILSRIGRDTTVVTTTRGGQRDAVQVMANGGVALVCAIGFLITEHPGWLLALAGSLAAANADTWSTEIGRTSPICPRLITTGRLVPAGTSGAMSLRGLVGAAAGALVIGACTALAIAISDFISPLTWLPSLFAIGVAGFTGSLIDSLLGSTAQERRWCDHCHTQTERQIHHCGTKTLLSGGIAGVTNDVVNTACVLTGALVAAGIGALIG